MRGLITLPDVLSHPVVIISGFGIGCFIRCLRAALRSAVTGRPSTFLACI